jgi:hypothetical protein
MPWLGQAIDAGKGEITKLVSSQVPRLGQAIDAGKQNIARLGHILMAARQDF